MSAGAVTRAFIEVRAGNDAARAFVIEGSTPRSVGRGAGADERFPHDPNMSDLHASLWMEGGVCYVRDLGSPHGTWVNERGVQQAALADGDLVQVGGTLLLVRVEGPRPSVTPLERADFASRGEHAAWFLRQGDGALFAVLDAARDEQVLPFLYGAGAQYQSLYEGLRGEELALVAPYLVALPHDAAALDELVAEAWGASWGVFLRAGATFRDLRRHLRRLLRAELDDGQRVLFRFYDPRVLRAYLPTCMGDEAAQMFGPIDRYVTEGRRGETALRFRATADGVATETEELTADDGADGAEIGVE